MPRFFPAPARKVRGFFVLWLQPLGEPRHSPKGDGGFARPCQPQARHDYLYGYHLTIPLTLIVSY
jgi:hypothetical protein